MTGSSPPIAVFSRAPRAARRRTHRACRIAATLAGLPAIAAACAAVRPEADFRRTAAQVAQRTGAADVYDPAAEARVATRVGELLADGLTPDEAVSVALLNNPEFQSLFMQIGASRADVVQSRLLTNPGLSLSVRFPEGGGRRNLTLGFAQELVDLWQIPIRSQIATAALEQLVLDVVQRGVALTGQTRSECFRLMAAERGAHIAAENVQLIEQSLALTEKRVQAGETSRLDANLVQAGLLAAKLEQQAAARDVQVARAALGRLLGLSRRDQPWTLVGELPASSVLPADDRELLACGLADRTDARAKAQQLSAATDELKRQWLNIFPSVQLGVEDEALESRGLPGRQILADTARASVAAGQLAAPSIQTRRQRAAERRQIIDNLLGPTLAITLPIWDQNQAQIAKARFTVEQRRREYESLLDAIADEIQESAAVARVAATQADYYRQQVLPRAEENLRAARQAYDAGEQSVVVLIEAQEFLVAQRRGHLGALRDQAVARAALEQALGGRLPASPATQPVEVERVN
ncbi:MAG: TolC family protein [Phycisphaerae bacterium]